jgi:type II secretory pathway pseudopilin PulG
MNKPIKTSGFTLLEMMVTVLIVVVVVGILSGMAIGLGDTARIQEIKGDSSDQARRGMLYIIRDLRQADGASITGAPGDTITYRVAADVDGNGTAVDVGGDLELGPVITAGRDVNDLNNDGLTLNQFIWSDGNDAKVFANNLLPNEDGNNNGVLDSGEDANGNGILDRGLWFGRNGSFIEVTIQTGGQTRRGRMITFNFNEVVRPRN